MPTQNTPRTLEGDLDKLCQKFNNYFDYPAQRERRQADNSPAGPVDQHDWFYLKDDRRCGPFSFHQMQDLLQSGLLEPNTPVWREGLQGWPPAKDALEDKVVGTLAWSETLSKEPIAPNPRVAERLPAWPSRVAVVLGIAHVLSALLFASELDSEYAVLFSSLAVLASVGSFVAMSNSAVGKWLVGGGAGLTLLSVLMNLSDIVGPTLLYRNGEWVEMSLIGVALPLILVSVAETYIVLKQNGALREVSA